MTNISLKIQKKLHKDYKKAIASKNDGTTVKLWNLAFDDLMAKGCECLHDYLSTNPNATDEDRQMCGIEARKK